MSKTVTYEIQTMNNVGKWIIVAVHTDREDALDEARKIANGRLHKTVRIIQESCGDGDSLARAFTMFSNEHKSLPASGPARPQHQTKDSGLRRDDRDRIRPPVKPREQQTSEFIFSLAWLVIGVGGSALVLIGLVIVFLTLNGA